MASVAVKAISLSPALRDLSFEAPDHAFTTLLGREASAALHVIAGLDAASAGEVFVGDRAVQALAPHRRDLTLTSARAPLLPHLTVAANLALALAPQRLSKEVAARRIREITTLLGLEPLLERKPGALAVADARRVEIARALAPQPKALLLDEPLAGLDAGSQAHLRADLARVQQHFRATVLLATTSAADALTLGEHVILLRHGTVEQQGPPLDLYRDPANVFVAATLGNPGMNFLRGALKGGDGHLAFKESDGGVVELRLPDTPVARAAVGRDVLLGIRPEDCVPLPAETAHAPGTFQALVDFVEIRDGATLYHGQTGAHGFIARAAGVVDPRTAGRRGRFRVDPARAQLFDPTTTRRLA